MQRSQSSLVISIHAPAKGATSVKGVIIRVVAIFQSTLPRRERRYCRCRCPCHFVFQSTLPRRERQCLYPLRCPVFQISIHAPAKGATGYVLRILHSSGISIHAPAKGATLWCHRISFPLYISIHAPAKGATSHRALWHLSADISIHAPAKGATRVAAQRKQRAGDFNPRSREGSDQRARPTAERPTPFQSTLPRRERPVTKSAWRTTLAFQSTLPRRERPSRLVRKTEPTVFQSTLPRRERHQRVDFVPNVFVISIHAPAKGATF